MITGDGIGNVIQSTPLMSALKCHGQTVDVLTIGTPPGTNKLLLGFTDDVYSHPDTFMGRNYDFVLPNWMMKDWAHRYDWRGCTIIEGKNPFDLHISESRAHYIAGIEAMGISHDMPPSRCFYRPPDTHQKPLPPVRDGRSSRRPLGRVPG